MKLLSNIIGVLVFGVMFTVIIMVCLFTPEKTKSGEYTNVYKYWTSDAYICENFCTCKKEAK